MGFRSHASAHIERSAPRHCDDKGQDLAKRSVALLLAVIDCTCFEKQFIGLGPSELVLQQASLQV